MLPGAIVNGCITGPSCSQASFVTHCNVTAYAAGDSGTSQKASGSEAVTEAGSKVASAVSEAGEHFLRASAIPICFVQVLHNSFYKTFVVIVAHINFCVIAHVAGDSIAKSQKAPGGEATKDTASEGAAAAKNLASKGATAAKDAASEGAKLASKAGRFFHVVVSTQCSTGKEACKST